jgi:hypothetical protein
MWSVLKQSTIHHIVWRAATVRRYVTEILLRRPLFRNPRPRNLIIFLAKSVAVKIELAKKQRSITDV